MAKVLKGDLKSDFTLTLTLYLVEYPESEVFLKQDSRTTNLGLGLMFVSFLFMPG